MIEPGTSTDVFRQTYGKVGEHIFTREEIDQGYFEHPCECTDMGCPGMFELPDGELVQCNECKGKGSKIVMVV